MASTSRAGASSAVPSRPGSRQNDVVSLPPKRPALAGMWQMPLLLVSLAMFGGAAYLFIDPRPEPAADRQLRLAEGEVKAHRYVAAVDRLSDLLRTELPDDQQGEVRLRLAEALDAWQRQRGTSIPKNHRRIVEETSKALSLGVVATSETRQMLARNHAALGETDPAVVNYHAAIDLIPEPADRLPVRRTLIDLLVATGQPETAAKQLNEYVETPGIADDEKAWALGELANLAIDQNRQTEALMLLDQAKRLSADPLIEGQVNYRLGYVAFTLGNLPLAESQLLLAREQLGSAHRLEADVCLLLGKIEQQRGEHAKAEALYDVILTNHPGSRVAPEALLHRGTCRVLQGKLEPGQKDLVATLEHVRRHPAQTQFGSDTLTAVRDAGRILADRDRFELALELMAGEQQVLPEEELPANFFARLGLYFERHARRTRQQYDDLARDREVDPEELDELERRSRQLLARAGDAYVAYSRKLTLVDDAGYGDALWKGVDLYDEAAAVSDVIGALQLFAAERPDDPLAPEALFRLGRAYQSVGRPDKAIETFKRIEADYPLSLAAARSAVPLSQALVTEGPDGATKAEGVLLRVIDNNRLLSPESETYKAALFELATLYYKRDRFDESIARLEEFSQRYPDDERHDQILFIKADCHRKSAQKLADELATLAAAKVEGARQVAANAAKRDDLETRRDAALGEARRLFDVTIDQYRKNPPSDEMDKLYEKLAHFYRADCVYDLGDYAAAIPLYDAAAFRYQDDPAALAAYVQIVNSHCNLGNYDEARTANERAKWLLRRIPPEAFTDGRFHLPREYWEQWLKWAGDSGLWQSGI